jgi:formylglycine-generating enzyme required for sulfatase activity
MGAARGDSSEQPPVNVTLAKPFAIGRSEVTVAEWRACAKAGGCTLQVDPADQPNMPMRNISYDDAKEYVSWLSAVSGKPYRLPSEAEWEFATRGGSTTRYPWGDEVGKAQASCSDCGGPWNRKTPEPVDAFPANDFGLFGANGSVAEWVEDCWARNHPGARADGQPREEQGCSQRVLRGGSWRNAHTDVTASSRLGYDAGVRYYTNGLRVARDID